MPIQQHSHTNRNYFNNRNDRVIKYLTINIVRCKYRAKTTANSMVKLKENGVRKDEVYSTEKSKNAEGELGAP